MNEVWNQPSRSSSATFNCPLFSSSLEVPGTSFLSGVNVYFDPSSALAQNTVHYRFRTFIYIQNSSIPSTLVKPSTFARLSTLMAVSFHLTDCYLNITQIFNQSTDIESDNPTQWVIFSDKEGKNYFCSKYENFPSRL